MRDSIDDLFDGLPQHLTVDQLAGVLGVARPTAYSWLSRGVVPAYKVENTWVILRDEVKEYLRGRSNQVQGTAGEPGEEGADLPPR